MTGENLSTEDTACAYPEYDAVDETDGSAPATGTGATGVEANVWERLYQVEDPEMPISIVDLGLIYGVEVVDDRVVVDMTLTYTGCPARDMLLEDVESAAESADGVGEAEVRLVWSPDWTVDMVTERGREQLQEFGLSV